MSTPLPQNAIQERNFARQQYGEKRDCAVFAGGGKDAPWECLAMCAGGMLEKTGLSLLSFRCDGGGGREISLFLLLLLLFSPIWVSASASAGAPISNFIPHMRLSPPPSFSCWISPAERGEREREKSPPPPHHTPDVKPEEAPTDREFFWVAAVPKTKRFPPECRAQLVPKAKNFFGGSWALSGLYDPPLRAGKEKSLGLLFARVFFLGKVPPGLSQSLHVGRYKGT